MVAGANIATIVLMFLIGFSDRVHPVEHPMLSNLGLVYPVFLVLNFCFLLFWLLFKKRNALIPVLGFIVCYGPTRLYMPLNIPQATPDSALKVISYNVWMFNGGDADEETNPTLQYIVEQDADILCLQEADVSGERKEKVEAALAKLYAYADTSNRKHGGGVLAVYSKYPIVKKENIEYPSETNHSAAFYLDINGDTVIVINNHFESIRLSSEDRGNFKGMVKGDMEGRQIELEGRKLFSKLAAASKKRAPQADAVAQYIDKHRGKSMIVCGDFNDSPISYARRTVAKQLTDCYVASGNGAGISYHLGGFYVRIDSIMCSPDWMLYDCKVDDAVKTSDHYPIICHLAKRIIP